MERLTAPSTATLKHYIILTKPGILMGNAINALGGFLLASKGAISPMLFLYMILGLSLVMAAGCVVNNCIDQDIDRKMERTKSRAIAQGLISVKQALVYAMTLASLGLFLLFTCVNPLSFSLALVGLVIYILFYSYSKYYSSHGTLIGSFAGATPPAIGYCAVTNRFDLGALLIFLILVCWQMPHFYAIALYRLEDYQRAKIPTLPLKKGLMATKVQMLLYVIAFGALCSSLTYFGLTNKQFFVATALLSLYWIYLSIKGFSHPSSKQWGRQMFLYSLINIMGFSLLIPFCVVS